MVGVGSPTLFSAIAMLGVDSPTLFSAIARSPEHGFMNPVTVEGQCVSTGLKCVKSCADMSSGSYQSCKGCNVYVTCFNGNLRQWSCASGLAWNDKTKLCDWTSTTCECLQYEPTAPPELDDSHKSDDKSHHRKYRRRHRRRRRRRRKPKLARPEPTTQAPKIYKTYYGFMSRHCLACICEVEGCMDNYKKCKMNGLSISCGPFQIKEPYYLDAGEPGNTWKTCTRMMSCSRRTVRAYMDRYGDNCAVKAGKEMATCEMYARVHNGGPSGCIMPFSIPYWKKVLACCKRKGSC
ncbi:Invertebrate-type lysozyme [Lamellibrachia satsuma]|nr:Invertebrate-type lysozyme [Lamellibrachia satsuma]